MPSSYLVTGCQGNYSTDSKVSVCRFSKDDEMRKKWLRAIPRTNYVLQNASLQNLPGLALWLKCIEKEDLLGTMPHNYIHNNGRLCALHFKEEAFSSTLKTKLLKFAVPCLISDQVSLTKPLDCKSSSSLHLPESNYSSLQENNFSSPQVVKDSSITVTSSLNTGIKSINEASEKSLKIKSKLVANLTSPEVVEDSFDTVITLCCTDSKKATTFHKSLQDPEKRMNFILKVKHKNLKPSHIKILCPKHFSEDHMHHHSITKVRLKENTVPNIFSADPLNHQKDVKLFQKWEEINPMDHQDVTTREGISELHCNPREIDKFYVKVICNESLGKITKTICSSQISAIPSTSPYPKHLKSTEQLRNNVLAMKKPKKDALCSPSDTKSGEAINFLSDSRIKTVKMGLPDTRIEEKDLFDSSTENESGEKEIESNNFINDIEKHRTLKNTKQLRNNVLAIKKPKKDVVCSPSDTKSGEAMNFLSDSKIKTVEMGLPDHTRIEEKDVFDSSTENESNNFINDNEKDRTLKNTKQLTNNVCSMKKLKKDVLCSPRTLKNTKQLTNNVRSMKKLKKDVLCSPSDTKSGEAMNFLSDSRIKTVKMGLPTTRIEEKDLFDSSTENESNNFIDDIEKDRTDSNLSHCDMEMEGKINSAISPKIIKLEGGINPFPFQEVTEINEEISYKCSGNIMVPNEWWGITCTPQYIVCSKWNELYDPVFRVIIKNDCSLKIFIKGRECVNENRKVSFENISSLLQEVDSYQICAGIDDKSRTYCMGYLENGFQQQFSIWCKGCQRKGEELMRNYRLLQ